MAFRYLPDHERTTVESCNWCNMPRLCIPCGHARGMKLAQAASEKIAFLLLADPGLRPVMATITVKNGPDLAERVDHLFDSWDSAWRRRKKYREGRRPWTPLDDVQGSILSCEIKRGPAGGWHPHFHCLWLVPGDRWKSKLYGQDKRILVDDMHEALCREWQEVTGDSANIGVNFLNTAHAMDAGLPVTEEELRVELFEVFKYMCKPGETPAADVVHAWQVTQGKRLVRSHGILKGLQVPESLNDELLDGPSWQFYYRWLQGRYRADKVKFVDKEGREVA